MSRTKRKRSAKPYQKPKAKKAAPKQEPTKESEPPTPDQGEDINTERQNDFGPNETSNL